jgi:hypothetical protein
MAEKLFDWHTGLSDLIRDFLRGEPGTGWEGTATYWDMANDRPVVVCPSAAAAACLLRVPNLLNGAQVAVAVANVAACRGLTEPQL